MITRPLDLASRLKEAPAGGVQIFYINVGLLVLFFGLFGSRFVLSPGLSTDFALPTAGASGVSAQIADLVIAVPSSGTALADGQVLDFRALGLWLKDKNAGTSRRRLLVHASSSLPAKDLAEIYVLAAEAGFAGVLIATEKAP
jgi:biopolymer transport protein ExbD